MFIDREEDAESGLGEFEARKYEDETGRFTSIDEKWEEYRAWSPYNYSENDPIRYSDPTGFTKGEHQTKNLPPEGLGAVRTPPAGGVNAGSTGGGRSGVGGGGTTAAPQGYGEGDPERRPMQQQKGSADAEITTTRTKSSSNNKPTSTTVSETIQADKQGKHIVGHKNYQPGRSTLESNAQELLDNFHAGKVKSSDAINDVKTRVDFGKVIGNYVNPGTGAVVPTTRGIIHSSKSGAHIVPSAPN